MINPFFCYIFSFFIALLVYSFGWSDLYPPLTISILAFLLVSFILHFLLGERVRRAGIITFKSISENVKSAMLVTVFIYFLWTLDFLYEGGIPLVKIILKEPYNYRLFGIPSLHVFIVTFSSFYTLYLFQVFLAHRSKKILLLYILNLVAALLIYSRAMFFFNLVSCLFMYLIFLKKFQMRKAFILSLLIIPLFFFFGMLGSLRVSREANEPYNNENFMKIGRATHEFEKSFVPKEYFWSYIYISSPLANLQQNINDYPVGSVSFRKIAEMINSEILPDFISKRITRLFDLEQCNEKRITGPFNVSTVYSRSYSYAGWGGMVLTGLMVVLIPLFFLKLLPPSSDFFLTGWATLCTMYFFLAYDNTLKFTGLSFQLAYPLCLHWMYKFKIIKTLL